jgi:hypothetical protein
MERTEMISTLIEQVERRGMRVASDSGLLTITASDDERPDDTAEMQQLLIKPLGKFLKEVSSIAMSRSRGARGKDFLGREVFVPSQKIMGKLEDVNASGIVTVSYANPDQTRVPTLSYAGPGDDLLIIVPDERTNQASQSSFSGIPDENVLRLFEFAESIGLSLEHDSGFTIVKWRAIAGVERKTCDLTIRRIGSSMRDVVLYTVAQARGRRGASFVGSCVFVPAFDAFGILASSNVDGSLTLTYRDKRSGSDLTCYCRGDDLLILRGDPRTSARSPREV